jgi:hypothetical protein
MLAVVLNELKYEDIIPSWQFLTGDQMPEGIKIVALEQLVRRDGTLNGVFILDYGEAADRESIGGQWTRSKVENEEEV